MAGCLKTKTLIFCIDFLEIYCFTYVCIEYTKYSLDRVVEGLNELAPPGVLPCLNPVFDANGNKKLCGTGK